MCPFQVKHLLLQSYKRIRDRLWPGRHELGMGGGSSYPLSEVHRKPSDTVFTQVPSSMPGSTVHQRGESQQDASFADPAASLRYVKP